VATYERLSGLDEAFLAFETPSAYMHVAATAIFDAAPLRDEAGGLDIARIRRHVASRLGRLPRFRQRLAFVPVVQDAIWVDDERFDLAHHVRHASLPRPGSDAQLRARCAEILERPLDRKRPLWEVWLIEGLADDAAALVAKVHHCIVDGIAGVGVLANLLSLEPRDTPDPPDQWTPRPAPSPRQLVRDEARRRVRGSFAAGRAVMEALTRPQVGLGHLGAAAGGLWRLAQSSLTPAPVTPFNQPIGPHRQVTWLSLDLERLKRVKRRLGGTVNDVVLTCVAGAMRALFARHGETPPQEIVRAAVPVSVRTREDAAAPGNRVSIWIVPLPLGPRDPRERFSIVNTTTEQLKERNHAAGAAVLTQAADWTGGTILSWAVRLLASARIYNVIVTNVPGPPVPLYLLGARLRAAYPHLPLFENQGLGIALLSYLDRLYVGLTADWNQAALAEEFAVDLEAAVDQLAGSVGLHAEAPRPPAPTPQASFATIRRDAPAGAA
jgi:WS/DGAT/MGAT family acyltransferase